MSVTLPKLWAWKMILAVALQINRYQHLEFACAKAAGEDVATTERQGDKSLVKFSMY